MHIRLIVVGKLRELWAKLACEEYQKRLRPRFRFDCVEVPNEDQMEKQIIPRSQVWMFDEQGSFLDSRELAMNIKKIQESGSPSISLLIGGPDGFPKELKQKANAHISLSRLTFPYQLARVIVLEQIYRASSILKGEPYHR